MKYGHYSNIFILLMVLPPVLWRSKGRYDDGVELEWSTSGAFWPNTTRLRVKAEDRAYIETQNMGTMEHLMNLHGHPFNFTSFNHRPTFNQRAGRPAIDGALHHRFFGNQPGKLVLPLSRFAACAW